ncbi:MAG: hypothetical protein N4A46_10340 [Schleiferiaceae bacterium]|jgi:hypothetical protein|nr:hypothetical protein [Schleiferiaceae bacterium]
MREKPVLGFVLALLLANIVIGALHLAVNSSLDLPLFDHLWIRAYLINFGLAALIGMGLYALRKKYTQSLGFIFLFGTAIKFGVYFIAFHPEYKLDGVVSKAEFITFFIPYSINLIVETTFLVRVLNRMS